MADKDSKNQKEQKVQRDQKDFRQQKQTSGLPQNANPDYKHIVRICNVDILGGKVIRYSLTNIKGIGINFADVLCKLTGINGRTLTGNLTTEEVEKLNTLINRIINQPNNCGIPTWFLNRRKDIETDEDKHLFTGTLTFTKDNDLKRLKKIRTLRGIRHIAGQPVRGQRTKSHFRKNKGKVVGVSKRKVAPGAEGAKGDKDAGKKGKK